MFDYGLDVGYNMQVSSDKGEMIIMFNYQKRNSSRCIVNSTKCQCDVTLADYWIAELAEVMHWAW